LRADAVAPANRGLKGLAAIALAALAALLALAPRAAHAEPVAACAPSVVAWTAACSNQARMQVGTLRCPEGVIVLSVAIGAEPPLHVEARPHADRGFRVVKGVALAPIGQFDDWSRAPAAARDAFDRLASCVEHDPSLEAAPPAPAPLPARAPVTPPKAAHTKAPWLLLGALAAALAAFAPALARVRARRRITSLQLVALTLATAVLRRAVAGTSFFHQGGHGCTWIGYTLDEASPYGPGFEEIFGWAARLAPDHPEKAVFTLQAALASIGPAAAWIIARRAGARPWLAWAAAIAVAIDPLLARLAGSESYYGVYISLLLLATALCAAGVGARRVRSSAFLLPTVAAGLVIAQAARVHPTGWFAAALVPLIHVAAPGAIRRRVTRAAVAAAVIGAVVAVTSAPALLGILAGGTGAKWLPFWRAALPTSLGKGAPIVIALAAAVVLLARRRRDGAVRAAAVAITLGAMAFANMHGGTVDWVQGAYARMYTAAIVATLAGAVAGMVRRPAHTRAAAAAVVALAVAASAFRARWLVERSTDAIELQHGIAWRAAVPPEATLVGLARVGDDTFDLHVFRGCSASHELIFEIDAAAPPRPLGSFGPSVFYYRSSLCSTAGGRALCDALERDAALDPITTAEIPARSSSLGHTYDAPTVRVGLSRVRSSAP
jgi:hypothetical protein